MNEHKPPRYMVSIEVYDNETQETLVSEGFNCSHLLSVEAALERARSELVVLSRTDARFATR